MFEDYKDKQPLFYEEIIKCINNNKISHAYLIETNNYNESDEIIKSFIKKLFEVNIKDEELCKNVFNLIDNGAYSDYMVIEPDGAWIKKDQILEVKEKFKMTSFENSPRIYLIKEADKLNKYAANSLLKFLEEPEGNIIAILQTSNRYKVIETLRSRCQIYSLVNVVNKIEFEDKDLLDNIVTLLENKGIYSIALLPGVLENDYRNKDFWFNTFNEMIELYTNSLRKKEDVNYIDYGDIIDLIIKNNSVNQVINKIDVLFTTIGNLEYNLNINMMLDKFIIDFTGGE